MTLQRVLFASSFASIAATAAVVIAVIAATADEHVWWKEMERLQHFASHIVASQWDDDAARTRWLTDAANDLDMHLVVKSNDGDVLFDGGPGGPCTAPSSMSFPIERTDGTTLGKMTVCRHGQHMPPFRAALAIGGVLSALWFLSALFARRAARPIMHLVDVAKRIGNGDLRARPKLGHRAVVEVRALADAIAEMADRIEQQLKDQRALLAGASHEMRTPLGHLRILVELLRANPSPKVIDDIEREVVEMDALIEKLLASSRLDFSLAEKRDVDARDLAERALQRAGEATAKLTVGDGDAKFHGDPTLLLGAIGNLVENAKSHGVMLASLTVELRTDEVAFVVDDEGPGIAAGDEERVFEPFFHKSAPGATNGSLGLGLSLVKRIAEAHGGRAFATNRVDSSGAAIGARIGFTAAR
jgi:signal transduction histidine kinase